MRHEGGDPLRLQDIDHAQQDAVNFGFRAAESGYRVDDRRGRFEFVEISIHPRQVHLEAIERRSGGFEPQQSGVQVLLQVEADREISTNSNRPRRS